MLSAVLILALAVAPPASPRTRAEIGADFKKAQDTARELIPRPALLHDKSARDAIAAKAIPAVRAELDAMAEIYAGNQRPGTAPDPKKALVAQHIRESHFAPTLVALGEKTIIDDLNARAAGPDATEALYAKAMLLSGTFAAAPDDAAQFSTLVELKSLIKDVPTPTTTAVDNALDQATASFFEADIISDQVNAELVNTLTPNAGPVTKSAIKQNQSLHATAAFEKKPIDLAGLTLQGKHFSTTDLKGKVILVDFWATWCGPCKAELPRVKAMYKQYHDKGLEVLGVSCDQDPAALMQYVAADPDMPWTQLFDANKPGWHAIATQYHITGIPQMFLIDKNGILRTTFAREKMEDLIPKMLAE